MDSFSDYPTLSYRYAYDAAGRLEHIERSGSYQQGTTSYRYDEAGRLLSIDSGDFCSQDLALCEKYTYGPHGQPREIQRRNSTYWNMIERYDAAGRLSGREWGEYNVSAEDSYTYDAAGRLTRY